MPPQLPQSISARPVEWLKALYGLRRVQEVEHIYCKQLLCDIENAFGILPHSFQPESIQSCVRASTTRSSKPRVHVDTIVTSKGNLAVRWYPKGHYSISRSRTPSEWINETDFNHGTISVLDMSPSGERPINEILFLRNFDHLPRISKQPLSPLKHCLLGVATSLVNEYLMALELYFDVTIGSYIQPTFINGRAHGWEMLGKPRRTVVTCEIGGQATQSQTFPPDTA
jgi:hypothetical protein